MKNTDNIWALLGELEEDEPIQVLTRLYSLYDNIIKTDPDNLEAALFFKHLENAISFCIECNLNRR